MIEIDFEAKIDEWLKKLPAESPIVVVVTDNHYEEVLQCLESLFTEDIFLAVIDDGSTDRLVRPVLEKLAGQYDFLYLPKETSDGLVVTINQAFKWFAPHDIVVLRSDTIVPAGWIERLKAAAYHRTNIATATALTNYGGMLSIPYRNMSDSVIANGLSVEHVDSLIQKNSLHLLPIIPTTFCHCIYYKRVALDVVGHLDELLPNLVAEIDFSQRAVAAGYSHVVADNLFVFYKGLNFIEEKDQAELQLGQNAMHKRYPWYEQWYNEAANTRRSPLGVALEAARSAFSGYRVAVDATILKLEPDGTQVWTLELIRALATNPERRKLCQKLTLIVRDGVPEKVLEPLEDLLDELEIVPYAVMQSLPKSYYDLLYRPLQIQSLDNLYDFRNVASRFILTQLDFIGFSNPGYHPSFKIWNNYRYLTQLSFSMADGVAFFSNDTLQDAVLQGMQLYDNRSCVIGAGVNHQFYQAEAIAPTSSQSFKDEPFIVMLGTNYKHKQRSHAIQVLKVLKQKYGWIGHLVMAGPNMPWGSSAGEEALARLDKENLELRPYLHYLGAVSEGEKRWLLNKAALVLYPSNYEGFGLVPFEAASAGTPCLTAISTSVQEVLGDKVVYLDSYNPDSSAKTVWLMLSNPEAAKTQVEAINSQGELFTWEITAEKTWRFFEKLLKMPPRQMEVTEQSEVDRSLKSAYLNLQQEYERLQDWAEGLNKKVLATEQSRSYKLISKFKRL
jgi:glycosyltransferase involved in cell wall biosynthesis